LTVTIAVSSDRPEARTLDAFEHVGRLFETDGAEATLLQIGFCTLSVALTQPVLETITHESTPVVPPIRLIAPLGA